MEEIWNFFEKEEESREEFGGCSEEGGGGDLEEEIDDWMRMEGDWERKEERRMRGFL